MTGNAKLENLGYNGHHAGECAMSIQADSALFTIKMLYTAIPAAMMVIALVFLTFYNVEKKLKEANV